MGQLTQGTGKGGKMHGYGIKRLTDGTMHEGGYADGYPSGYGIKRWADSTVYRIGKMDFTRVTV